MRFAIINELFEILEETNMDNKDMLEFMKNFKKAISTAPSLLVNEINDKIREYCEENTICPECFEDSFTKDYYIYGADADGNRGERRSILVCDNCGEELE